MPVQRTPWGDFPSVQPHTNTTSLTQHSDYAAARAGDNAAAARVVNDLFRNATYGAGIDHVIPVLHLDDRKNSLPLALADRFARHLGASVYRGVVQDNVTDRAPDRAIDRLLNQPTFSGKVRKGNYVIVDDLCAFGSTLANLRGYIATNGGHVAFASTLATALFATTIVPDPRLLASLRQRFGNSLAILPATLGFSETELTNREAHFVAGLKTLDSLRDPRVATHNTIRPAK